MNSISIITILIALYGAILSTYSYINNRRDKFPRIRVVLTDDQIYSGKTTGPVYLILRAENYGFVNVLLDQPIIEIVKSNFKFYPQTKHIDFPYMLESGKIVQVLCDPEELAIDFQENVKSSYLKIRGLYKDSLGRKYYSSVLKFNIKYFLRSLL